MTHTAALLKDRKIMGMKTKLLLAALALSIALNAYQWDSFRPWDGTAGFEHMNQARTPFHYGHHWRQDHREYDWTADNAASMAEARTLVAKTIVKEYGYRFPRWWEMSRWYEDVSPDFRAELEKAGAR